MQGKAFLDAAPKMLAKKKSFVAVRVESASSPHILPLHLRLHLFLALHL